MMRASLFFFVLFQWIMLSGQYTLYLETGDSIPTSNYYIQGDSVQIPGSQLAMDQIKFMRSAKGIYVFKLPIGPLRQVRMNNFGSPCSMGKVYAERYEQMDRAEQHRIKDLLATLGAPEYLDCYKKAMFAKGMDLDRPDRPGLDKGVEPMIITRNMVILRTGDTLVADRYFNVIGDSVSWSKTKRRLHEDEVLVLLTKEGQKIIHLQTNILQPIHTPVADLTPCSKGLIYAALYFETTTEWNDIPNIGAMAEITAAKGCFSAEQKRLRLLYPKRY